MGMGVRVRVTFYFQIHLRPNQTRVPPLSQDADGSRRLGRVASMRAAPWRDLIELGFGRTA